MITIAKKHIQKWIHEIVQVEKRDTGTTYDYMVTINKDSGSLTQIYMSEYQLDMLRLYFLVEYDSDKQVNK